jgi:hypothetical protein
MAQIIYKLLSFHIFYFHLNLLNSLGITRSLFALKVMIQLLFSSYFHYFHVSLYKQLRDYYKSQDFKLRITVIQRIHSTGGDQPQHSNEFLRKFLLIFIGKIGPIVLL